VNVPNIREAFRHETWLQEVAMIDRYTNTAPASSRLSMASLPPTFDSYGNIAAVPPSPSASMQTHPSATNMVTADGTYRPGSSQYTNPNQVASVHTYQPNASAARAGQGMQIDVSQAQQDGAGGGPRRATMARVASKLVHSPTGLETQPQVPETAQQNDLTPTVSNQANPASLPFGSLSLHGSEPKMFPGVVSRRRQSSVSKVPNFAAPNWGTDGAAAQGQDGDLKSSTGSLKREEDGVVMGGGLERKDTIEEADDEESEGP
jgi:AMP deaminase